MTVYLLLIAYVLIVPSVVKAFCSDQKKRNVLTAFWCILGVFLVLALKKYTVGIDMPGYREQFMLSQDKNWFDYDYVYFEHGYILLQQLFSKSDLSFELFTAFVYLVICIGLFLFIKKFSKDPSLSVLFFICYQFFLFNITGLRQALASGLCLISFVWLYEAVFEKTSSAIKLFLGFLLLTLAPFIHRSSVVFLLSLPILWLSKGTRGRYIFTLISLPIAYFLRPQALQLVTFLFGNDDNSDLSLGLSFVFLLILTAFIAMSQFFRYNKGSENKTLEMRTDSLIINMSLFSLPIYMLFAGTEYLRGAMYFSVFYILSFPNAVNKLTAREKTIVRILVVLFLIAFFYYDTLAPNAFDLRPYKFFWE